MIHEAIVKHIEQSIGQPSFFPPIETIRPGERFSHIIRTAHQKGLFNLTDLEITPDRINRAETLAAKIIRNPARSTGLTLFKYLDQGIPSSLARGGEPNMFETVQGGFNKIHFSFGIPYFYDIYIPDAIHDSELPFRSTGLVVLQGEKLLKRPDLKIPFMDTGLFFKKMNPLGDWIRQMEVDNPEIIRTDVDPTYLLYSMLLKRPDLLKTYTNYMHELYENYCLTPQEIEQYTSLFLASSFPLFPNDYQLLQSWQLIRSPEGNVDNRINKDEIKCVIVSDQDYSTITRLYDYTGIRFVNAGSPYIIETGSGVIINTLHLLKKYAEEIDAPELIPYIEALKLTQWDKQA